MTTPHERTRNILHTREFLYDLARGEYAVTVPDSVRTEAWRLLRHYPDPQTVRAISSEASLWLASPDLSEWKLLPEVR